MRTAAALALVSLLPLALNMPAAPQTPARIPAQTPPTATPATAHPPLAGIWLGTLKTGGPDLRLQLHLSLDAATSHWLCALDSLDQGVMALPCNVTSATDPVLLEVPTVSGKFTGTLSADTLSGTWTQGAGTLPLSFTRQPSPTAAQSIPSAATLQRDPALPPATADTLKAILDRDLAAALARGGTLAPGTGAGITVGVLTGSTSRVWSYGTAHPDSLFEIGSITKTFTGLLLAQMVEQGKVRLDEPVRELFPAGVIPKPEGPEITLLDLSDQHSGLPRMPDNFHPADRSNPYADYDEARLLDFARAHGVRLPPDAAFGYSNLGVGLLGAALARRAGVPYPELLHREITGPLGMHDTAVRLSPALQARFLQGYSAAGVTAHAWDLDALAGAGGIRSTAPDMLLYLAAQLHPDQLHPDQLHPAASSPEARTLPAAIRASHIPHAEAGPGTHIALNWFHVDKADLFWHNGATGGFSSFAAFSPTHDFALIVLFNRATDVHAFADTLGHHIAERLSGQPAVSLH